MRPVQVAIVATYLLCVGSVGVALLLTPGVAVALAKDFPGTVGAFLLISVVCGWPWLRAYVAASRNNEVPAVVFGVASLAIAGAFFSPIRTAPVEGVGWYVILCVLAIWLACLVIFWFLNIGPE